MQKQKFFLTHGFDITHVKDPELVGISSLSITTCSLHSREALEF